MHKKRSKHGVAKGAAIGVAIGAVVAGAAALLFAPKSGKELRKDIKKTAHELSNQVLKEVDKAKVLSKEKYHDIVEKVVDEYTKNKKVAANAVKMLKTDLKGKWGEVEKGAKAAKKKVVKK